METIISAVIIDDQQEAVEDLQYLIDKENPSVKVIASANSAQEGLVAILKHRPQLVFLDVVMPGMSGFELLELVPEINFHLVITTSFDQYAIQAIRSSAIDFLLKPVKASELKEAIERSRAKPAPTSKSQVALLEENLKSASQPIKKIALTIADGVQLVNLDDILYFESDGNYTTVFLKDDKSIVVSKAIGKFEEMIDRKDFFRIHNSYLININHVNKFIRSDGGYVVLENGKTITVARSKKDAFMEILGKIGSG